MVEVEDQRGVNRSDNEMLQIQINQKNYFEDS